MLSPRKHIAGFSLIQISILLTVASLLFVAVLPTTQSTIKSSASSVAKMNAIMTALRQYQAANGTLPCPADPTLAIDSANYGRAAANSGTTGNCIGGTPAAAYADTTNHIALGMVPIYTLGLSYDYALDGYGRDITYAVDTNATATCWATPSLPGTITVNNNGISSNTVVALISHGKDGYGAWLPLQGNSGTASRFNNGSTDTAQADNAQVAHGGGLTNNTTFVSFVNQGQTATFDDNVVYNNSQWNINARPVAFAQSNLYAQNCASNCAPGYSYCRAITLDHTNVPNTDQINFPMLFSGTYSYLATQANGGNVTNANGYDIIFTQDQAGTNKLNFEQESYTTTGTVNYWIKVPTVSHTTDTVIYIQYGNSSVTTDQSNKTGTWDSNYTAIYHLNESFSHGTPTYDSTSNGANLTNNGTANPNPSGIAASGKGFNASWASQYIYTSTPPMTVQDNFTMSVWVNPPGNSSTMTLLANGVDTTGAAGKGVSLHIDGTSTHWKTVYNGGVGTYDSGVVAATNAWTYIVLTRNNGTSQMYVNGVAKGSSWSTTPSAPTTGFSIGAGDYNGSSISNIANIHFWLTGNLDEARLSNIARSADWIATEYNNQSSPSTFYSIGGASAR